MVYSLLLTSTLASGVSAVSQTYTIKDLGTLGGSFSQANAINASGQIAGQGLINGEVHAFLATPCHRHDERGECCDNDNR